MSDFARVRATARVKLTVDFPVDGAWGDDATIGQVHRQAREAALRRASVVASDLRALIVGVPEVVFVSVEERA